MHHLIFEGAELAGKSWIMSQIYNNLEPKYNNSKLTLDGCHWFNADNGVFGSDVGKPVIESYVEMFKTLKERNLIVEKLHYSDIVYNRMYHNIEVDYAEIENKLNELNFKTILITFPEDVKVIEQRIEGRLNLYPHYKAILKKPEWYIEQQREIKKEVEKSKLPFLEIKTNQLPDDNLVKEILDWIGEK